MLDEQMVKTPGTDEWWILRLAKKLGKDLPRYRLLEQWMEGEPPLAMPDQTAAAFVRIQEMARLNLAELIVNAPLFRMQPLAVRTKADSDAAGDDVANALWKTNEMKVVSPTIIEWMLTFSKSYGIVGPSTDSEGNRSALITSEHPMQVIGEADPTDPKRNIAALKIYRDDLTDSDVAVLYRPGYERVLRHYGKSVLPNPKSRNWSLTRSSWTWDLDENGAAIITDSGLTYVPVFEFPSRNGKGEFEKHLATLKRINHTILQRMIIIAMQAFRQRGIKGVPNTDKDGKEIDYTEIFTADPGSLWILPATAELWESGQADFSPVLTSVKNDIEHLAVASMTPLYTIVPDAANGSAEGAALQREGLIFKTEAHVNRIDGRFAAMTACALEVAGHNDRSNPADVKIIWASSRRSSLNERAQAALAAKNAGLPWRLRMEKFLELSPEEISEAEEARGDDAFLELVPDGGQ